MGIIEMARNLIGYPDGCWCRRCIEQADKEGKLTKPMPDFPAQDQVMVVCVKCGNKRCPHATSHENACTDSNKPGQPGSDY